MSNPRVFISSTIYDFSDLRSSIKYWLREMGFDAQLSEENDFDKDTTKNSYTACLESISDCDYFVLLIGARCGGMYPSENISITRKEYRTAYELARAGKIKKLIIFIRQSIWDVREDRKALHKLLKSITLEDFPSKKNVESIEFHGSSILNDAEHILSFIDEVTRKDEAREGKLPPMNWIHTFSSFEDIIDTLKTELRVTVRLSIQVAEQNVQKALMRNLCNLTYKDSDGHICVYFMFFKNIRNRLKLFRDTHESNIIGKEICIPTNEAHAISNFILFFRNGIKDLFSFEFESIIASGVFLEYDPSTSSFANSLMDKAIYQMVCEIHRLKMFEQEMKYESQDMVLDRIKTARSCKRQEVLLDFYSLAMFSSIYERLDNILVLTAYILSYIETHDKTLEFPSLLNGLVNSDKPTEVELLNHLNSI